MANRFRPRPVKENAVPNGPRDGVNAEESFREGAYDEAGDDARLLSADDPAVSHVPLERREFEIALPDGSAMAFSATSDGVIRETRIVCADGRVLALRTSIETIVPPLWFAGEARP